MKRTYRVKVIKRSYVEVTVDSEDMDQTQVYELVEDRLKTSKNVKWGDPTFNIVSITNDQGSKGPKTPQIRYK